MELPTQKLFKEGNNWREETIWKNMVSPFYQQQNLRLRYNPPNPRILSFLPCLECVGFTQISLSASTIGIYSPVAQYLSGIYAMCTQRMLKKFVLWLAIFQFLLALFKLFIFFFTNNNCKVGTIHLAWIYFHLKSDKSSFNSNYVQQAHVGYGSLQK